MQYPEQSIEMAAACAFDNQSAGFDKQYKDDLIIQYKREKVRKHLLQYLASNARILELNSGTGEDAIFLEQKGFNVLATDISQNMVELARKKAVAEGSYALAFQCCSFHSLNNLNLHEEMDHIFSNFAGLNCSPDLAKVLTGADKILKPGGKMTLVLLPSFCLWEFALIFKGKFKTAFRRFKRKGATAKIGTDYFPCFYYNPGYIKRHMPGYKILNVEGLCTIVPPSYLENFGKNYPRLFQFLKKAEGRYSKSYPWRSVGDYYIITLQKPLSPLPA